MFVHDVLGRDQAAKPVLVVVVPAGVAGLGARGRKRDRA